MCLLKNSCFAPDISSDLRVSTFSLSCEDLGEFVWDGSGEVAGEVRAGVEVGEAELPVDRE
jgi:hypothetical protein